MIGIIPRVCVRSSGKSNKKFLNWLSLRSLHSIQPGQEVKSSRSFTQKDVNEFAVLTGDTNPIHTDPEYAKRSGIFPRPVVHGALINAFVCGLLGTKLPGPGTIAVSQEIRFPKPLYVGETVHASVSVIAVKKHFIVCRLKCTSSQNVVLDGKATVMFKNTTPTD